MMKFASWSCAALALAGAGALLTAAPAEAQGKKVCYAFQDLSTGFWGAGHEAIVSTLQKNNIEVVELNGGKDANRQLEQVKDCIAQGADGIILTADDGDSETMLVALAQEADVPIATFNRPPSDLSKGIIVVADNELVARLAVEEMAVLAEEKFKATGKKLHPLILVGDLADPNAVKRREGFMNALKNHPDIFETPVEINTKWNSQVALAGLEAAVTADPDIDFIFTSSDFLFPTIQGVLEPRGKWKKTGEEGHVILGGLDGDDGACKLIREGYVDSTGVQDVYLEAKLALDASWKRSRRATRGRTASSSILASRSRRRTMPRRARRPGAAWSSTRRSRRLREGRGVTLPAFSCAGPLVDRPSRIEVAARDDGERRSKAAHSKDESGPSESSRRAAPSLQPPARLRILHPLPDLRLFPGDGGCSFPTSSRRGTSATSSPMSGRCSASRSDRPSSSSSWGST